MHKKHSGKEGLERYKALCSHKRNILCRTLRFQYCKLMHLGCIQFETNGRGLLALNMSGFRIRHSKKNLSMQKTLFFFFFKLYVFFTLHYKGVL